MAVITPNTNIRLIKLPIELSSSNQLTFTSATAQYNYFHGVANHLDLDNATYMRKDGTMRFNGNYDQVIQYNYCMYQNESYSSKWFYAYISDIQYLSNESVAITLKTDVFQTWQFDLEYKQSFIEREHVTNDSFGANTVPENLELGELVCNEINKPAYDDLNLNTLLVMAINKQLSPLTSSANTHQYGGVFSGLYYVAFKTAEDCAKCINAMDNAGQGEMIENIFILPNKLLNISSWSKIVLEDDPSSIEFWISAIDNSTTPTRILKDTIITRNTSLNGYTPKNNKLFCYPFNYMLVSNNAGQQCTFNYEDFTNGNGDFDIVGTITAGGSIRLIPRNYKGIGDDTDATACNTYGLTGAKYPTCAWVNDAYTNWLTQNSVNLTLQYVSSVASIGLGSTRIAMGDVEGADNLANGVIGIADELKTLHQAEFMPNQASGNANSGDIQYSAHMMQFDIYQMSVKKEYAKIIDNYFSMFGYKVNVTKVPNINTRSNWNYVKTIGCNLHGYIPNEDINELANMFNAGLTLWHNASTFLDYTQSNPNV